MTSERRPELDRLDRRLRSALMAFFARRIHNRAEAEDLTQEVFSRLADSPTTNPDMPDAYVFRIAANLLSDRARREAVRRQYREAQGLEEFAGIDPLDPYRIAAGRDELARITRAIADLPDKTRRIFILYRIEHIDKAAISESLGLSIRMVEIHVRRALETLTEKLERDA